MVCGPGSRSSVGPLSRACRLEGTNASRALNRSVLTWVCQPAHHRGPPGTATGSIHLMPIPSARPPGLVLAAGVGPRPVDGGTGIGVGPRTPVTVVEPALHVGEERTGRDAQVEPAGLG